MKHDFLTAMSLRSTLSALRILIVMSALWVAPASGQVLLAGSALRGAARLTFSDSTLAIHAPGADGGDETLAFRQLGDTLLVRRAGPAGDCAGARGSYVARFTRNGQRVSFVRSSDACPSDLWRTLEGQFFEFVNAAGVAPRDWAFRDPVDDSIAGISLYRAYGLLPGRPFHTVIVAVIDNGFDLGHEDLNGVIWTNPKEVPGNGVDDDHNGYIDDVHGWNFRTGRDGTIAENDQSEATRVYARWRSRFDAADSATMDGPDKDRYRLWTNAKRAYLAALSQEPDSNDLAFTYNPHYSSSAIIGDDPDDADQRDYGSPFFPLTPALSHGTHVAGIIGAERDNSIGTDGVADHVLIMPIVATTATGDERDKDVANAIRYAVDNGARIINMSFSKLISPQKHAVDDAIRYAEGRDVLIVHAAGNDGEDDDSIPHFPIATDEDGSRASNFLTVGWSRSGFNARLAHPYSDYGARTVDVFAPGSDIFSTIPGNGYDYKSGSSMSTPFVTGVAAILLSYFPSLSVAQVKEIIMRSSFKPDVQVNKPGTERSVPFRSLSVSGGIVNAYAAVAMAIDLGVSGSGAGGATPQGATGQGPAGGGRHPPAAPGRAGVDR